MSLKVGEISFINFIPLESKSEFPFGCEKFRMFPSELNNACRKGLLDVSPISFYAYPAIENEYALLPNFCIASDGEVLSVKLFSKWDISELGGKKIFLTPDSESSIAALRAVCKSRFGYDPADFRCANINEADAVFLIGDKALAFGTASFGHVYDLGALWKESFGIPLVFAAIAVKRRIHESVKDALSSHYSGSLAEFYSNRDAYCELAAARMNSASFGKADADRYFSRLTFEISDEAFEKNRRILHG